VRALTWWLALDVSVSAWMAVRNISPPTSGTSPSLPGCCAVTAADSALQMYLRVAVRGNNGSTNEYEPRGSGQLDGVELSSLFNNFQFPH
jgi:hypothetical protein